MEPMVVPAPGDVEEIVVTGSRLRRAELSTPAPVTVVTRQQMARSGRASVGDILQMLPAQSNAYNTQVNNGGDGSTRVDLRGLGSERTLVLLNGRRFVGGGLGADASVDLNAIPLPAIERVEVLKDGASAVYGSDAVGGVVNIVTKKNWTGTELNLVGGLTPHGDAQTFDASVTTGQKTGRGWYLLSAGYFRQDPVWCGDRDWSRYDRDYNWDEKDPSKRIVTQGSPATPQGWLNDWEGTPGNDLWNDTIAGAPDGELTLDAKTGKWRAFDPNGTTDDPKKPGDMYNFAPSNYLVTPQTRLSFFSLGNLNLTDAVRGYYEASFTNRNSSQVLAPTPLYTAFAGPEGVVVSKDSYYNPFGRDFTDIGRRLVEFGNRRFEQDVDTYRVVAGVRGDLTASFGALQGWSWDVSANFGRTTATNLLTGNLRVSRLATALGPSFRDADGLHCGTPEAPIAGCVPLNLFGGAGSIGQDARDYLAYTGTARGFSEQSVVSASTSGELFKLFSNRRASLALGYELRREAGGYQPDPLAAAGDSTGNLESPVEGVFVVNEGFAELSLPVTGGKTGVQDLEFSAAARVFNYSSFGAGATYKLGGRWKIVKDLTLRGTFSTAFRAPHIYELYSGRSESYETAEDPCSTAVRSRSPTADARCKAEGLPDDFREEQPQIRTIVGGNDALKPETAKIFTVGAVVEPRMVKGLALTLDYYRVDLADAVAFLPTSLILNACYEDPNPQYCDRIHRGTGGHVTAVDDWLANVGGTTTGGVDLGARYDLPTAHGLYGFNLDLSWLETFTMTLPGKSVDGVGNYDLGFYPPLRMAGGASWSSSGFSLGVSGRWSASFRECKDNHCVREKPADGTPLPELQQRTVDAYLAFDAFAGYEWKWAGGTSNLMLGVNNVTDQDPPVVYNGTTARSDTSAYDFMGRYVYLRANHAF